MYCHPDLLGSSAVSFHKQRTQVGKGVFLRSGHPKAQKPFLGMAFGTMWQINILQYCHSLCSADFLPGFIGELFPFSQRFKGGLTSFVQFPELAETVANNRNGYFIQRPGGFLSVPCNKGNCCAFLKKYGGFQHLFCCYIELFGNLRNIFITCSVFFCHNVSKRKSHSIISGFPVCGRMIWYLSAIPNLNADNLWLKAYIYLYLPTLLPLHPIFP